MLERRAVEAGIETPTAHSFRRAFALSALRNGVDVYSLQRLMGHSSIQMLQPYLAQTNEDIRNAHSKGSVVRKTFS